MKPFLRPWILIVAAITLAFAHSNGSDCFAQSGLRESLERMDRNGNGKIDPSEITSLSRPYLERVAKARRMSLDKSYNISQWQEAARLYYALANGVAGKSIEPDLETTVKSFRPDDDDVMIPEFGLAKVKYPYIKADLDEADTTLKRYDRDNDGFIDRAEARRARWTHRDPFEEDYDLDGRLSRLELAQRYARRRLLEGQSGELVQKAQRVGTGVRSSSGDVDGGEDSRWWRRGGSQYYLTAAIMERFDTNRNGQLEPVESAAIGIPVGRIDINRDGVLSRSEVHAYMSELQDEAGDETLGIPAWFFQRDLNRDGQITMAEYTDEWTDQKIQEFASLDANGDGILTKVEVTGSAAITGGTFANTDAMILAPRKTVISEIVIEEPVLIADLDVQLSITHSYVAHLDAYLESPDGDRIELFAGIGGSGDHFEKTIFDDQAQTPITKAQAPFEGRYLPGALIKNQPSLSTFTGRSAQGVWKLVVAGMRNERFGMLHRWSLIITPQDRLDPAGEMNLDNLNAQSDVDEDFSGNDFSEVDTSNIERFDINRSDIDQPSSRD